MTVAVGLVCSDGVLVASDSMGSDAMVASHTIKVHALDRCPVIWTASGSVYVIEEVDRCLRQLDAAGTPAAPLSIFTKPDKDAVRSKLTGTIRKQMLECYQGALASQPIAPGQTPTAFLASFLVLGYANGIPWFLEFDQIGQVNWHTDVRFYATGSGGPFAQVAAGLMRHYISDSLTLELGKSVAYRTIETTIEVSSQSVGLPVQMAICDADGARVLTTDEIDKVSAAVQGWKELEAETLRMRAAEAAEPVAGDLPAI